jgi:superfamily II DNA or RNA helicase
MNTQLINELKQRSTLTQNELQDAVPLVFDSCSALLLEWITGLGKGRSIMKACEHMNKVLFVVEKLNHIKNFKDDCDKHGFGYDQYVFVHYNSLKKHVGLQYDCVVLDEADVISDAAKDHLTRIGFNKLLLLTAKFPLPKKLAFYQQVCRFDTWAIDLKQANKWSILPVPEIHIHYVTPSTDEYLEFDFIKSKRYSTVTVTTFNEFVRTLETSLNVHINANQVECMKIVTNLVEYYRDEARDKGWGTKQNPSFPALCCYRYGSLRKSILSKIKLQKMRQLHLELQGRKVIFVNAIEDVFTEHVIYSDQGKTVNEAKLNLFNNGEINELSALKMLNRAVNLVNCPIALVGTISNSPVELIQQIGRSLRHPFPQVHIPIVKGDKDDKLIQKQIKTNIIYHEN